ncbi:MAG: 4-coumarate--CoA ligase family protein [Pseudomonadota bacterium]
MIITSDSPDVVVPDVTITDYVLRHHERLGAKPALIDGPSGRTLTYGELAGAVQRVAGSLAARGFGKGDVMGIYCPNMPEYAVVFFAVATLGGINTTANPLYTADELAKQLNDSGARSLVTVGPFLDKALEAASKSSVNEVFCIGAGEGAIPFAALMEDNGPPPSVEINPREDLVVLPYSSGTTGLPKGVMLTHYNLVANLCQCEGMEGFSGFQEDDVVMGVLPFFHIYGMVVIKALCLAQGGTVVTMPRFDLEEFLGLMDKHKVTLGPLVPPIVLALAKHPIVDNFDLSHLRLVFSGAAPLSESLAEEASQRLNCPVIQGYGMTEASPVTHLTPHDQGTSKAGAIGKIVPNSQCKIVDVDTGDELNVGEEGELWIAGPQIMKGYLNRPEETADCLDADGWYHTGDIGKVDEAGYFYIVDRVKELIKYKGMQVAPAELEGLLLTHESVADAAVIPSPDDEAGELPKAFVVLKPDQSVSEADLMSFIAGQVAPHKRIRLLDFVSEIPKSASGKILRRNLVEQERAKAG